MFRGTTSDNECYEAAQREWREAEKQTQSRSRTEARAEAQAQHRNRRQPDLLAVPAPRLSDAVVWSIVCSGLPLVWERLAPAPA